MRVNFLIASLFALLVAGCSTTEKKSADTPEGAFAIAQDFEKDSRFEEAIRRYNDIKNKFPYSKYATMSEIAVADVYFKQESFAEAQASYQAFRDLHPKHPQIDYIIFRIGLSYFMQLPSTIDRDLTLAAGAISNFSEVLQRFPKSEHAKEAKEKLEQATKMLAEKEIYIADYYFNKGSYDSALGRYENLLRKYRGLGFDSKALSKAAISASKVGKTDVARKHLQELTAKFPNTSELEQAKKEVVQ